MAPKTTPCRVFLSALGLLLGASVVHAAPKAEEPTEVVARLYHDYAWETVIDSPTLRTPLLDQTSQVLQRYFTKELSRLLVQDRLCRARTRELCKLDYRPIWASQESGATDLRVQATDAPDVVRVQFRYPGTAKPDRVELRYRLVQTEQGWRIADLLDAHLLVGSSLRQLLGAGP